LSKAPRIASLVALALLGTYLLAAVLLPRVVDADAWRPEAESRLSGLLGANVALGRLRLSLWAGIAVEADGVRVGRDVREGLVIEATRVSVRPRVLSLLRGDLRVRSIRIDDAVVTSSGATVLRRGALVCALREAREGTRITGSLEGETGAGDARTAALSSRFHVVASSGRVAIETLSGSLGPGSFEAKGEVSGLGTNAPKVRIDGTGALGESQGTGTLAADLPPGQPSLSFEIRSPFLDFDEILKKARRTESGARASLALVPAAHAEEVDTATSSPPFLGRVVGRGRVTAERARLAKVEIRRLSSSVAIEGGEIRFHEATFDVHGGKAEGAVVVGLTGEAPFRVTGGVEGVGLGPLVAEVAPSYRGGVSGTASMSLDLGGRVAGAPGIVHTLGGSARLAVRDGKLETFGILKQVRSILEMAGGRGIGKDETPFERLTASFAVQGGNAETSDLEFRSPDIDLDGGGVVDLGGPLKLQVLASFSKAASDDLVRETRQLKVRVGPDGRLTVPLAIRGTLTSPQVKLDLDRVLKEGLQQSIEDLGKKSLLRKLLGKD
jgi:hypothetical protein